MVCNAEPDDVHPDRAAVLSESWSRNAGSWLGAVRDGAIESRRLVTDEAVVDAILALGPRRVLDLGCGEGWLLRALSDHGIDGVGFDASAALIQAARGAGGGRFLHLGFQDFTAAPATLGGEFDAAVANFALLQEDLLPLLRAVHAVLRPGGALVVQTLHPWAAGGPYRDGWREERFRDLPGDWQPMPWYFRTLGSWLGLLRAAGYVLAGLREPTHPRTGLPVSLLLVCRSGRTV